MWTPWGTSASVPGRTPPTRTRGSSLWTRSAAATPLRRNWRRSSCGSGALARVGELPDLVRPDLGFQCVTALNHVEQRLPGVGGQVLADGRAGAEVGPLPERLRAGGDRAAGEDVV